jgi:hypothetical protein
VEGDLAVPAHLKLSPSAADTGENLFIGSGVFAFK